MGNYLSSRHSANSISRVRTAIPVSKTTGPNQSICVIIARSQCGRHGSRFELQDRTQHDQCLVDISPPRAVAFRNHDRQTGFSNVTGQSGRNCAMSKYSSKSKRRSTALSSLGIAGLSLALASGASASTSGASTNVPSTSQSHKIFLGEEEISDVSLATFYVFDKENAGPPPLAQKVRLARCARGYGCSNGSGGCGSCGHPSGNGGCGGGVDGYP
jgi:hypothetical protein